MSLEEHAGILRSSKPGMMGAKNKYNQRGLLDGAHEESEELWEYSGSRLHPSNGKKESIAHYVTLGQTKGMESLPYGTFKDGRIPHTYKTLSIDFNAEPTSAPINQMLSPMEFAALANVSHLLPPDYLHDKQNSTVTSGRDDVMRYGKARKWRTSYSKAKSTSIPYMRTDRTSSTLSTFAKSASSRGITEPGVIDTKSADAAKTKAWNAMTNHLKNLAVKIIAAKAGGKEVDPDDPDLLALLNAGVNSNYVREFIATTPYIQNIPGIQYAQTIISTLIIGALKGYAKVKKDSAGGSAPGPAPGGGSR